MKFTKEEISLCKQIAEKHRREIYIGEWLYFNEEFYLVTEIIKTPENVDVYATDLGESISADDDFIPLWTISDCLEFLRERGFTIIQACEHPMSNEWIVEVNPYFSNAVKIMGHKSFDVRGDTLLIACLKAVLAVLEEEAR